MSRRLVVTSVLVLGGLLLVAMPGVAAREPAPTVEEFVAGYQQTQGRLTVGLDVFGIGMMHRTRYLSVPRWGIGATWGLGVAWRTYFGQPSVEEVREAAEAVAQREPDLTAEEFSREVFDELNRKLYYFAGVNTFALILPNVEGGLSYQIVNQPGLTLNLEAGLVWGLGTVLLPLPWIGGLASF